MKKFYKFVPIILVITFFATSLLFIGQVFAQGPEDLCLNGTPEQKASSYCQSLSDPNADPIATGGMLAKVTNIITYVAGFIAVFWIIIQAIKMATSHGKSETIAASRNGIIYAVVGLAVVLIARTVINFALNQL